MRLLLVSLFCISICSVSAQTAPRLLDTRMKLKTASIRITTDGITATTFMELEYYNFRNMEIEGLVYFKLEPEQIVTHFQLELNGNYRDGSIEEKWKATNAYNRIVGKRVDPALLTKDYNSNYTLRIYPLAAQQSRKVTITIQQLLLPKANKYFYSLPFSSVDTIERLSVSVQNFAINSSFQFNSGLLYKQQLSMNNGIPSYANTSSTVVLNKPIQFELQHQSNPFICTKQAKEANHFAIRYLPKVDSIYQFQPKRITVFWDVSATGSYRNTEKEISFLKQYVTHHKTDAVTLITFNHFLADTLVIRNAYNNTWRLTEFLRNLTYDGGTRFSNLNFSAVKADAVLLFTDGKSSWGTAGPVRGKVPVYTISTSAIVDSFFLKQVSFGSGGTYMPLHKYSISTAVEKISVAENYLVDIVSSGKSIFESSLNEKLGSPLLIYGTSKSRLDTITLVYGNQAAVYKKEQLIIDYRSSCNFSAIDRLNMLESYKLMTSNYNWNDVLDFGLREKVVTPYTAYIVLERIEDYIQYNITPPAELEEECRKRGYVKKDTRAIRNNVEKNSRYNIMRQVADAYNKRIKQWNKSQTGIVYNPAMEFVENNSSITTSSNASQPLQILEGKSAGVMITGSTQSLQEVVVVGYGVTTKRSLGYAVSSVSSRQLGLYGYQNVGQMLAGRVPGLNVSGATGEPGSSVTIRIRGASSFLSSAEPLYILDGMPISGNINNAVNPNDIESISVLKDAGATAIYGTSGANGVIIITTKKGSRNYSQNYYSYKLKNQPDVDYLQEIKHTPLRQKLSKYRELELQYKNESGFYFDMAEHLYAFGFKEEAITALMNAAEPYSYNRDIFRIKGFVLQSWKEFDLAIEVFKTLNNESPSNLRSYRDLAWAYYQNKNYQQAVNVLYNGINNDQDLSGQEAAINFRALMLNEMNAIIQMHKDSLNLSAINSSLIYAMPNDLRITIEDINERYLNVKINEPGGVVTSQYSGKSKNAGYFTGNSNYFYDNNIAEYQLSNAVKGNYKIWVNYYNGYLYTGKPPALLRVIIFKNFGKPGQSIEIQNVMMDNQNGEIEVAETSW